MLVSIICVCNNREILENCLVKGLGIQTYEYELIILDNSQGKFKSAAEALNSGAREAKGELFIFVHQDIKMEDKNFLEECFFYLVNFKNAGIFGIAGKSIKNDEIISNMMHGNPPVPVSKTWINSPVNVQTLDECLLIIPRQRFIETPFDAETCDDWHLYGVDYCLTMISKGYEVVVLPLSVYHLSDGVSLNSLYFSSLEKVIQKHKHETDVIATTVQNWRTDRSVLRQKYAFLFTLYWNNFWEGRTKKSNLP